MANSAPESCPNRQIPAETMYSAELLRAVGLMILTAAAAEGALSMQLWRLSHHPRQPTPASIMPLWSMETKVKLEKISVLARLMLAASQAAAVIKLCEKIRSSFSRRNELAHYVGSAHPSPNEIRLTTLRLKPDGSLERDKTYPTKHIVEYARILNGRVFQLDQLLNDCGVMPIPATIEQELLELAGQPNEAPPR